MEAVKNRKKAAEEAEQKRKEELRAKWRREAEDDIELEKLNFLRRHYRY